MSDTNALNDLATEKRLTVTALTRIAELLTPLPHGFGLRVDFGISVVVVEELARLPGVVCTTNTYDDLDCGRAGTITSARVVVGGVEFKAQAQARYEDMK